MIEISIIIPAYNEQNRIGKTLDSLTLKRKDLFFSLGEVIIVNDGSKDDTLKVIENFKDKLPIRVIDNQINSGAGNAIKQGLFSNKSQFVVYADADESTDWLSLNNFYPSLIMGADLVIGTRQIIDTKKPIVRKLGSLMFKYLGWYLLDLKYKDLYCGFKAFKKDAAQEISKYMFVNDFAVSPEILFLANKLNYKVCEIQVKWKHDYDSKVTILCGIKCLISNFRIRFYH